ncbi:D-alanyl-D-alanine carboxypeptidase family protein [Scopulibacillus cellulosilyticus]|uniref:serine-type D-Ala-D-Ala carboxypeptidase n=1 Tax=Scopulibacillus cellulosilyticus TaxID=2665665 RepID=A0ABW2PQ24_9BACL
MKRFWKRAMIMILVLFLLYPALPMKKASAKVSVSAESAILMDQTSGRVLFRKDIHKKMRIASITKVMTAILAIESGKMDETVKISSNAVGTEGSSIYLKKGERIKLKDLVYGLMLRSGNDAAVAIAEKVGGSADGFVYLMNKKAHELGMLDTHFSNPHGLDGKNFTHYSTAYDMALLTKYAMKNEQFRKIFKTKFHSVPQEGEDWPRSWKNKNKLLFRYDYSTGGKTGFTKLARRTLISTASKDDLNLITVTLNDGDDWKDHMNLFNWGFKTFDMTTIVKKGKISGIKSKFYKNHLYAHRDLSLPLTNNEQKALSTEMDLYQPPKNGKWENPPSPIGKLYVKWGDKELAQLPLFYHKPPKKKEHGFWTLFKQVFLSALRIDVND